MKELSVLGSAGREDCGQQKYKLWSENLDISIISAAH